MRLPNSLLIIDFCLHASLISYQALAAADTGSLQAGVADGGKNGNPGVKVRVTGRGFEYINTVVRDQMTALMPHIRIDDITVNQMGGSVTLTNARVTNYKPPDQQSVTPQPPGRILVVMRKLAVSMTGHVFGTAGFLSDQGDCDVTASDTDVTYELQVLRQSSGQFGIKTASCKAEVGNVDINIYNSGLLGKAVQAVRGLLTGRIKREMADQICAQGKLSSEYNSFIKEPV